MNDDNNISQNDAWNPKSEILYLVLREYHRIYKESLINKKGNVSKEIVKNLFKIFTKILSEKENADLLKIFLGINNNLFNYSEFIKLAIDNNDNSRFRLIRWIIVLIQKLVIGETDLDKEDIEKILTSTLFQINKLIIDNNDLELFKEEIDLISKTILIQSPVKLQEDLINDLYKSNCELERIKVLKFFVKYRLTRNFANYEIFSNMIDNLEINNKKEIKNKSHEYFICALIYRTFFMVGSYILYENRRKKIDGIDFIKILWMHTQPEDAETINLNLTPMEFDEFWLVNLFLFGGINSEIWDDILDYKLENFHEIHLYVAQHFILSFIKSYEKSKDPFNCSTNECEMEQCYDILIRILSRKEDLIKIVDKFSQESEVWSPLYSKDEIERKLKATIINEKRLFDTSEKSNKNFANILLNEIFNNYTKLSEYFEFLLPLADEKVNIAKNEILKSYLEYSRLPELFEYIIDDNLEDLKEIVINHLIPKNCFIKTSNMDCGIIWIDYGRNLSRGEEKSFGDVLKNDQNIEILNIIELNTSEIIEKIQNTSLKIVNRDFKPNLIIIPSKIFSKIRKDSINPNSPTFDSIIQNKFLKVNENVELEIFYPNNFEAFNDIIIMDTRSIQWKYKFNNNKRLLIDIKEYEENKSMVDVLIKSEIKINVIKPNGIKILKIEK